MFVDELLQQLDQAGLQIWAAQLENDLPRRFSTDNHGDYTQWAKALGNLPQLTPSSVALDQPVIRIGDAGDLNEATRTRLYEALAQLHPWRKGPIDIFGVYIDSEWRSDWKWQRLAQHVSPLGGRKVLDVGCGNGYFAWRMRGAGAAWVVGVDPTLVYTLQFQAIQTYIGDPRVHILPIGIDEVPGEQKAFDTVFSMGVFYHRRSPLDHLLELKGQLRPQGELVLETLVIEGGVNTALVPKGRYARMRNVWFIPSVATMEQWLERCGFSNIQCVDVSATTPEEQRSTQWMRFQSLADFLDPTDSNRTIEGYPAPRRAIFVAYA